jgi:hypothetical protein
MIPDFDEDGNLPVGVHWAAWPEIRMRYGTNLHRRRLLEGLREVLEILARAGCEKAFVDGSFVTAKDFPRDYDMCWDLRGVDPNRLEPVFFDFTNRRSAQKRRFMGEFFPAQLPEGFSGKTFLEFFQIGPKGIVAIDLRRPLS